MDTKISDLDAITTLVGTEEFVVADSGETHKITATDLVVGLEALGLGGGGGDRDWVAEILGTPDTAFEFDTSSLTGLTVFGSIDSEDADTTIPDHYFIADNDGAWCGRYVGSLTTPFTAVTKISSLAVQMTDGYKQGLWVGNSSAPGSFAGNADVILVGNSSRAIWVENANTANVTNDNAYVDCPVYLAIRANSSSDVDYLFSLGGMVWRKVVDSRNPSHSTLVNVGIAMTSGVQAAVAFDYLRIWNSAKSFPGALA